jgi:hypothetical protein
MLRGAATDLRSGDPVGVKAPQGVEFTRSCEMAPPLSRLRRAAQFGLAISDYVEPAEYCLVPLEDAALGCMVSNGSTAVKSRAVGTPRVSAATC